MSSLAAAYIIPSDITLGQAKEMITLGTRLYDFFQGDVHVGVAADEMAIESFAGFELDEHRVALGCGEEAEGELAMREKVSGSGVMGGGGGGAYHGWNEWNEWVGCLSWMLNALFVKQSQYCSSSSKQFTREAPVSTGDLSLVRC